jgi:hypothetical protein
MNPLQTIPVYSHNYSNSLLTDRNGSRRYMKLATDKLELQRTVLSTYCLETAGCFGVKYSFYRQVKFETIMKPEVEAFFPNHTA